MPIRSRLPSPKNLPAAALAVLVAALGLLGILRWVGQPPTVAGPAEWIWADLSGQWVAETAFYLVREFEFEAPTGRERLWVQGDREYLLWLNGRRVGSGTFSLGEGLDEYQAGPWLRSGTNRLVAEVRSLKGQGGFLLALSEPGEVPSLVTDESWRVVLDAGQNGAEGLIEGWAPLLPARADADADSRLDPAVEASRVGVETASAYSWGRPPIGRWGILRSDASLPLWSERFFSRPRVAGKEVSLSGLLDQVAAVDRTELPDPIASGWVPGDLQVFDFQREVQGWIGFRFRTPNEAGPTAFLVSGRRNSLPPLGELQSWMVDRYQTVALAPLHTDFWRDSVPRRFRWVVISGDQPVEQVWLDALGDGEGYVVEAPALRTSGLFGIVRPPSMTTVETRLRLPLQESAVSQSLAP